MHFNSWVLKNGKVECNMGEKSFLAPNSHMVVVKHGKEP